jgi:thiamine-phosphate pyrophosphorylase
MRPLPFPVLAIADEEVLGAALVGRAAAAVRAGLPWVCLRARSSATRQRVRRGLALRQQCPGAFLSVHGDAEACAALGAPGLHLPSRPAGLAALRRELPGVLLGVSCHSRGELEEAAAAGADYAFLSPLFAPVSKPAGGPVLGPDGFREAVRALPLPVLALGGVTPERLADAAAAGAAGAAVLGSLFQAPDPAAQARAYREAAQRAWGPPLSTPNPPSRRSSP